MKRCVSIIASVLLTLVTAGACAQASLYDEASFAPLAGDRRSFRVGDLITVLVYEQSSAVASADTDASRSGGVDVRLAASRRSPFSAGVSMGSDFEGGGKTQRSGRLLAQLTVQVMAIMPTGELQVAGDQQLIVNDEQQTISLEGRLRPIDVSENNTVLSSRLAGARISYKGDGTVDGRQRPGLWQSALHFLGL